MEHKSQAASKPACRANNLTVACFAPNVSMPSTTLAQATDHTESSSSVQLPSLSAIWLVFHSVNRAFRPYFASPWADYTSTFRVMASGMSLLLTGFMGYEQQSVQALTRIIRLQSISRKSCCIAVPQLAYMCSPAASCRAGLAHRFNKVVRHFCQQHRDFLYMKAYQDLSAAGSCQQSCSDGCACLTVSKQNLTAASVLDEVV